MRNFILFIAFSTIAFGQCGTLAFNPITHRLDCIGTPGSGNTTVTGTANQITVTGSVGGPYTLSFPTNMTLPGVTTIATLSAASGALTIDSSGNIVTTGTVTTGFGSGVAGTEGTLGQGTAPSVVANSIIEYAPASVTGYRSVMPGAAATGIRHWTASGTSVTETISAIVNADLSGLIGLAHGGLNLDLTATGGASQVLKQTSSGGAITVARLACADLSDAGSGCSGSAGATLGANTFTGAQTITVNGALSAPGLTGTGTWITGGTNTSNKPYWLIEPAGTASTAWPTTGTALGINAAAGFSGDFVNFQIAANSINLFRVTSAGNILSAGNGSFGGLVQAGGTSTIGWGGRSDMRSTADKIIRMGDSQGLAFNFFHQALPTIASGFGSSPSIAGSDSNGRVTVGTGGSAATGTINFAVTWGSAPMCTANNETTLLYLQATASTTTLVLTSATPFGAADKLTWLCIGNS